MRAGKHINRFAVLLLIAAECGCSKSRVHSATSTVLPEISVPASQPSAFKSEYQKRVAAVLSAPDSPKATGDLALFFHANGFLDEAAMLYRDLHRKDRAQGRWAYYLSRLLHDKGDSEGAHAFLNEVAARTPDYPLLPLRRAELLYKSGDVTAAEKEFRVAASRTTGSAHALLGLGRIAVQRQAWPQAEAFLDGALKNEPGFASANALLVTVHEAMGNMDRADELRRRSANTHRYREPDDAWLDAVNDHCFDVERLSVLADIATEGGRVSRAIELLRRSRQIEPKRARTAFELGNALMKSDARADALTLWREAVALEPTLADAHYALIAELERSGDVAGALAAADVAVAKNPRSSGLQRQRGIILQMSRRGGEAVEALQRAITLDATDVKNFEALGNLQWAQRQKSQAVEQYEKARALSRLAVKPRLMLGGYYLEEGQIDRAAACIREALEIEPEAEGLGELQALLLLRTGNTAFRSGRFPEAREAYLRALDAKPDHQESLTNLVLLLLRTNAVGEAQSRVAAFIAQFPNAIFAYALAGRIELQSGNRAEARRFFERGIELARQQNDREQEQALRRLSEQAR